MKFQMELVKIQNMIPHKVGSIKLIKLHFHFPVSFLIVNNVVAHGKCNKVKIITLIAVITFHPFSIKIFLIDEVSSISTNAPLFI